MKKIMMMMLFAVCAVSLLYGQEMSIPYHASDTVTYFSEEIREEMMDFYQKDYWFAYYWDQYLEALKFPSEKMERYKDSTMVRTNQMFGIYFKVHPNFALAFNNVFVYSGFLGMYPNGGLIWNSEYGSIGLFGGYLIKLGEDVSTGFHLTFIPVINTSEYPVIGAIIRKVEGIINISNSAVQSADAKMFSVPIGTISLGGFYKQEPFYGFASTRIFGGLIETSKLLIELGWQQIYDITEIKMNYTEQSLYGRIQFKLDGGSLYTIFSARYHPLPKCGLTFTLPDDTFMYLEAYWWPNKDFGSNGWEIILGFRMKEGV